MLRIGVFHFVDSTLGQLVSRFLVKCLASNLNIFVGEFMPP